MRTFFNPKSALALFALLNSFPAFADCKNGCEGGNILSTLSNHRFSCSAHNFLFASEAGTATLAIRKGEADLQGFILAYSQSCDFQSSLRASKSYEQAEIFAQILGINRQHNCRYFYFETAITSKQAADASSAIMEGRLDKEGFFSGYGGSCDYENSVAAATNFTVDSATEPKPSKSLGAIASSSIESMKSSFFAIPGELKKAVGSLLAD